LAVLSLQDALYFVLLAIKMSQVKANACSVLCPLFWVAQKAQSFLSKALDFFDFIDPSNLTNIPSYTDFYSAFVRAHLKKNT